MTPEDYGSKYLNMTWRYGGATYRASVNKYLAMDAEICDAGKIKGAKTARQWLIDSAHKSEAVDTRGKLWAAKGPDGSIMTIDEGAIKRSFNGKASPSDLASTLWLATHLGFITADVSKLGHAVALPQKYTDWYLGLDCSGFAMNYLGLHCLIKDLDVNHQKERRLQPLSIKTGDIQVTNSAGHYKHIAVVTSITSLGADKVRVNTIESYGHKLQGVSLHHRDFVMKSPGVFRDVRATDPIGGAEYYFQPVPQRKSPTP